MENKLKGLLGMAQRAKKIVIGETAMQAIRSKKAKLVILAGDCSERTQKKVMDKCSTYQIDVIKVERSCDLSDAIGKGNIVFLAIVDEGFAKAIKNN